MRTDLPGRPPLQGEIDRREYVRSRRQQLRNLQVTIEILDRKQKCLSRCAEAAGVLHGDPLGVESPTVHRSLRPWGLGYESLDTSPALSFVYVWPAINRGSALLRCTGVCFAGVPVVVFSCKADTSAGKT